MAVDIYQLQLARYQSAFETESKKKTLNTLNNTDNVDDSKIFAHFI